MNWKHWLSIMGSAFAGGAVAFVSTHLSTGIPTTTQGVAAFLAGAGIAGLVAVLHLYTPVPAGDKT